MKIEPTIIDKNIESKELYTQADIKELQDKLSTINYRLESINLQLQESLQISGEEQAQLKLDRQSLEDEKIIIERKLQQAREFLEKLTSEPEGADEFVGVLDEETEELFSARDIGKATVPKICTLDKKAARKNDDELLENDNEINDEFKKKSEDSISKLEDLFK